ncbi:NAD-dependent epimerase/dehydratase family protein [Paraburkholderia silviterrae]|uniref:NAD-dependent epimerase/dehydratase family protein n=1 Tax=Paraburkholderia silviterrae TaxID=2528715 RepID=A0A4R5LYG8_9BURK|nr:NAD-dependent epimerase/dehydratase family protein [Paraburkholderia silviterrae]TDG17426.1 NAD-dependent epimerase/dehydratase family protein [Paraburkholderia silviterrae]
MGQVVVTGANGFVGRELCRQLLARGHRVIALVRTPGSAVAGTDEWVFAGKDYAGIGAAWPRELQPDCIVHLAARVHILRDDALDPDAAFHATNVEGTIRLARAARERGVGRFVYASSIKAIAEMDNGRPLREDDAPMPQDAYGRSKLAAEAALKQFGAQSGLDVVSVRPPLVYGPQVRANFLRMMDAVRRGMPLPLGAVQARRSLVYVGNLADALVQCAFDPRAANQTFHVADDVAPSVPELLEQIGVALGRPARLLPIPPAALRALARLARRPALVDRLTCDLRVDSSRVRSTLGWQPGISLADGLRETARWYLSNH